MNALISYQFDDNPVRVVMIGEEPWFVANDVALSLGYRDTFNMVRLLDEDEKGTHIVSTLGGEQEMNIISESGLYHAAIKRRGKEAQRFRKWVTAEVLPTIRKTGRYVLHEPPPAPAVLEHMDVSQVNASVGLVREARRLFGPKTAREVWIRLGLPVSIVEAQANHVEDAAAEPLRRWLIGRTACTAQEAAEGIGFSDPGVGDRQRIAGLLRQFGWHNAKVRDGDRTLNRWFAPTAQGWHGIVGQEEA